MRSEFLQNKHKGEGKMAKEERVEALLGVAKELLKNGMAVDQVAKFVALPIEEIEALKDGAK